MTEDNFINEWIENAYDKENLNDDIIDKIAKNIEENEISEDNLLECLKNIAFEEEQKNGN
ncbi:MAG: hypothetical protein ACOCP4_06465 [Candidatus Woesearchaeota archaeon]